MKITYSQFEDKYRRAAMIHSSQESVSYNSALENLWFEFKKLGYDENLFFELLEDWEIN